MSKGRVELLLTVAIPKKIQLENRLYAFESRFTGGEKGLFQERLPSLVEHLLDGA